MNADALWQQCERQNQLALWRARAPEALFLSLVLAAVLALLLWVLDARWQLVLGAELRWNRWSTALLPALMALGTLTYPVLRAYRLQRRKMRSDWLAAQPLPNAVRRHAARHRALLVLALRSAAALLLWAWVAWRLPAGSPWLNAVLIGILLSPPLLWLATRGEPRAGRTARRGPPPAISVVPPLAHGMPVLGLALEPQWRRLPRTGWALGLGLLLIPMGSGLWLILGVALGFTAFGAGTDLVAHWRLRYLADVAWLAALPLPPRRLFLAYGRELARRSTAIALALLVAAHACGLPLPLATALALAATMLIAHALLLAYATRAQPHRFRLQLPVHYAGLLASTQVFLPLLLPLWLGLCWWLWRRGSRLP
ncbi:MAG: hypothetical protein U1F26_05405 [Lysobacterales bacterium]